jgi:hypothetical protein
MSVVDIGSRVTDSILGEPKRFFPLNFDPQIRSVRDLYEAAKRQQWNATTDIPWDRFDPSRYSAEQLEAARRFWSHRAWIEYQGGVFSTSAELTRYAINGADDIDLKLFLSLKIAEEARHAEASYLFAERLGGYYPAPSDPRMIKQMDYGLAERVLHERLPTACTVIHMWAGEMVASELFMKRYEVTSDPVAREICRLILRDEVRHVKAGELYLAERIGTMTPAERALVQEAIQYEIEEIELKGFHGFKKDTQEYEIHEREAFARARAAGLGATSPEDQAECLRQAYAKMRATVTSWGLQLPRYEVFEGAA